MKEHSIDYDVIILGAGPAGLAAGIYTIRRGMKTLILETGIPGGRATTAPWVENYPGFDEPMTGLELTQKMYSQLNRIGGEVTSEEAVSLKLDEPIKTVMTRKRKYTAKTVIIAIGVNRRQLHIKGEMEFLGAGVSYCSLCDGPMFRGKKVAVIGSGEEALEDAKHLTDIASHVILVSNDLKFSIPNRLLEPLKATSKIRILEGYEVQSIEGERTVKSLKLKCLADGKPISLDVDGIFIAAGVVPMTDIIATAGVEVDKRGCILVNRKQATNIEGVFAAGDCTCGGMQIATAVGEGAMAAISASRIAE